MPTIRRSRKKLSAAQIAALSAEARRVDVEEAGRIRRQAHVAFARHATVIDIVRQLKAARERQGLSLADLAARTGIAKPNLSRFENTTRGMPKLDTLNRVADELGLSLRIDLVPKSKVG